MSWSAHFASGALLLGAVLVAGAGSPEPEILPLARRADGGRLKVDVDGFSDIGWTGPLGTSGVAAEIIRHKEAIKACVQKSNQANPALHGTLKIHWLIVSDGRVSDLRPLNVTAETQAFADCLVADIQGWHFQASDAGAMPIDFPFKF